MINTNNRSVFRSFLCSSQKNLKGLLASDYGTVANLSARNPTPEFSLYHQNPAFGPVQIRELTEIFVEKSLEVVLSLGFQASIYSKYIGHLAPRCLGSRKPESRWYSPHRCSLMVEQNDTRCHRPGWYALFSNL